MRIDKLQIQNYRCFEEVEMNLHPHFNLLVGNNGSGKTTALDALAVAIGFPLNNLDFINTNDELGIIKDKDIREKKIDDQPRLQLPSSITALAHLWDKNFKWNNYWILDNELGGKKMFTKFPTHDLLQKKIIQRQQKGNTTFPLFSYYGTGRLWGVDESQVEYQKQEDGLSTAYKYCLTPHTTSKAFLSWYKTMEDEIRKFDRAEDKVLLKVINSAITSMIPEWTDMAFSFREDDLVGILDGEKRNFRQLSDGYRNTIGMVADMIYRCIQLNPHLGKNVLKETPGVVLIDEIDLHLHPIWQSRIIEDLHRIFPKVQFVATTHSPTVVANYNNGHLFVVSPESIDLVEEKYFGKEVNDVLVQILNAPSNRHIATQEKLDRLYRLVDDEAPKKDYFLLLKELEELLGEEDSEIQKIQALIDWNQYKKDNPDAIHS